MFELLAICGPIALLLSIIALKKIDCINQRLDGKEDLPLKSNIAKPAQPLNASSPPKIVSKQAIISDLIKEEVIAEKKLKEIKKPIVRLDGHTLAKKTAPITEHPSSEKTPPMLLEQKIGTRWIPIAGIISLIFAAGFFLKYAYDNFTLSPVTRMLAVAVCGVVAITAGEITRRREYDIVAKSVTSLGFGLLYAAVFAGYGIYDLLETWPALTISVTITAVAMAWAVRLDEVVIAFLSLLGGFLTPIIIASDQNLAMPLFIYLAVLGSGAMLCAYYRKWRAINFLAFAGTYISYTLWIINSYRPDAIDSQRPVALIGLIIFFAIYFIMPILYELIHAVKAKREDVLLILSNASVTMAYLFYLLHHNRLALGLVVVALAGVHFAMMAVVYWRCSEDRDLRMVLQGIGLFMVTISIPQFAGIYTLSLIWVGESIILAIIGLRYRSILTQIAGGIALILGCGNLMLHLPLHNGGFRFILNGPFGAWCFVAIAAYISHLVYRKASEKTDDIYSQISQWLFILSSILLTAACIMEWYFHCDYNLLVTSGYYIAKGPVVVFALMLIICNIKPVYPAGKFTNVFAMSLFAAGLIVTALSLTWLHNGQFMLILNKEFMITMLFIVSLTYYHLVNRFAAEFLDDRCGSTSQASYAVGMLLLMAALCAEWYFHFQENLQIDPAGSFLSGIAVILAAITLLLAVRPICPEGLICRTLSVVTGIGGAICIVIALSVYRENAFTIFLNSSFVVACVVTLSLAATAIMIYRQDTDSAQTKKMASILIVASVALLWIALTEEIYMYWYCVNEYEVNTDNWKVLAHTYISITWAIYALIMMVIGFWKRLRIVRYASLALFAVLLAKVFLVDTSQVENIYRVGAFVVTGLTLVGVSYLYQYLKKKGFFEVLEV